MTLLSINWGNALIVTFLGFAIVVVVLILLIFIISLFGKIMAPKAKVTKSTKETQGKDEVCTESREHIPALDSAAIATAIHLYFDDPHDVESGVVTIKTVERRYSPWNSKIYGLNNNLTR
ncbi:MAG: OadG family transporter subunit [Candidatus Aphodosoma sp.]